MARLTDPDRLAAYLDALSNWAVGGYIRFKLNEQAAKYLRNLGIKQEDLKWLMYEYVVLNGGEIDEVKEDRPEWRNKHEFHWDLRFRINEKSVYVETRLSMYGPPFKPDEPEILVVNIHDK